MAHGLNNTILKRGGGNGGNGDGKASVGSRRIFAPQFKLQVLDSYRNDADCKGNQRATARKYGIHRRQIQKWLQVEGNLRNSVVKGKSGGELIVSSSGSSPDTRKCGIELALRNGDHRQRDDVSSEAYSEPQRQRQTEIEAELERVTSQRIGATETQDAAAADKRVPDIPQQHSPCSTSTTYSEWRYSPPINDYQQLRLQNTNMTTEHDDDNDNDYDDVAVAGSAAATTAAVTAAANTVAATPNPVAAAVAETNLLCSGTGKCDAYPEATVQPARPPVQSSQQQPLLPLDFTTHSRRSESPPALDNAAPMDLSLKKPCMPYPRTSTPVPVCRIPPGTPPDSQIWDLSTTSHSRAAKRPRPRDGRDDIIVPTSPSVSSSTCDNKPEPKPVKLFKPYLDDDEEDVKPAITSSSDSPCHHDQQPATVYSSACPVPDADSYFYINNNNNDYPYFKDEYRASRGYYHPDFYPGLHFQNGAVKQRQTYSLDFKLSAIECYYSDAICRGNQRAVASKYNIHRRQVQKWLKQEDQLRQRNETTKHMHIVR